MSDRNGGAAGVAARAPAGGTTRIALGGAAGDDARGARFLAAVRRAVAGDYDALGELGRGADGVIVYLARELSTGHLVALRLTPGDHTARDAGEMWLEVLRRLDDTVPAAGAHCPRCERALAGWGRFCGHCGADLAGVAPGGPGAAGGTTPAELLRAVQEAARGRYEVLGEMARAEGGGVVYFARDLRDGAITALRLQRQADASGRTQQYQLGRTQVLRSVADLLDGPRAPAAAPEPPPAPPRPPAPPPAAAPPAERAPGRGRDVAIAAGAAAVVLAAGVLGAWLARGTPAPEPAPAAAPAPAPAAAAPPDSADLQIGTLPPNTVVTVDGRPLRGAAARLPAGAYTLRAAAPGRAAATQRITLARGQTVVWTPTFAPTR